ncbi:major facilitator superfamily domain-containing protein [Lipomyces arxii]|uniref:major facilitator superfamily domain-containing protein n=1 Tax=Lipomyces arxii TaxID=56418 RepID=UPI0034CD5DB4
MDSGCARSILGNEANKLQKKTGLERLDDTVGGPESVECPEKYTVVQWEGPDDSQNPMNMSLFRKWVITMICSFGALNVTCTSIIYASAYEGIAEEFHSTRTKVLTGVTVYLIGIGLGPMLYSPLSEFYGRRYIYIFSFTGFLVFMFPIAFGKNLPSIVINRFLSGCASSAFMSVSGGTIADMFRADELGLPMMAFTASPFLGPILGPIIGDFIVANCNWRWVFYVMMMWTGAMLILVIAFVPETFAPVILTRKAIRLRKETGNNMIRSPSEQSNADSGRTLHQALLFSINRPLELIIFEPMIISMCVYSMILLGILYLSFEAFPLVYRYNHGFKIQYVGLTFIGLMIGQVIAACSEPYFKRLHVKLEQRAGKRQPEFRLPQAIVGSILCPISLFWFAFTTYKSVHWIVPIIATVPLGTGMLLVFSGIFTYKVEAYRPYSASALAANSFFRCTFGSVFPLFAIQMYDKLGYVWASFLLACLVTLCMPFPLLFYKYGERLRAKSRYAFSDED